MKNSSDLKFVLFVFFKHTHKDVVDTTKNKKIKDPSTSTNEIVK